MEEAIQGGCGVRFHVQRYKCNGRTIACEDCSRRVPTAGVGYYFCNQCKVSSCMRCTFVKQGHQGSSNAASSSRASPLALASDDDDDDDDDDEDEPTLPCAGLLTHPFEFLQNSPYYGNCFVCNMCGEAGYGELYHCESCQFDAHKQCAEVEEEVKVSYHRHLLQRFYTGEDEEDIMCQFCQGEVEEDVSHWVYKCPYCTNFAVHARCAKYAKSLMHASHPHKLKLVHKSWKGKSLQLCCDGCGNEISHTFHYTCTKRGCDFDLHPLCAVLPSKPLCRMNPSHRVEIDYFPLPFEQCALCDFPSDEVWLYRCSVCDVSMHVDCFSAEMDEDFTDDEDDEEDELGELYQFIESMDEFDNQGNEEKVDKLSELVHSFKSTTEAAAASSLARQNSVKSRVHPKVSSLARSERHILDQGFANMSLGDYSPPRYQRDSSPPPYVPDDSPQSTIFPGDSPPFSSRESDAAEEERRRIKQVAKEQKRKEKAAARELQEQEKAARRKEKAKNEAKFCARLENVVNELQNIWKHGGRDADINQRVAELKAIAENGQALMANGLQEIIRTQVQSTTRAVPRLVLCTETSSMTNKLLTSFRVGIKVVQLHLLCEHEQQPHVVAGAEGCEINQKVAGDRWSKLQPFLAAGLRVVGLALNLGTTMGVGLIVLNDVLPDLHKMVTETQAIDLGKHAVQTARCKVVPSQEAVAEEAAAQWLVSFLVDQKVDIAESFKLYRVRYKAPERIKGNVGWLCDKHLESGRKKNLLERFPR